MPRVSIITPVYNGARTIAETIESVLAQSESRWEHLIVDDRSTDPTAAIVRAYQDPRIRYCRQPGAGRSAARNWGIEQAQGDYLLFLDADDWLLPNALAAHIAFLDTHSHFGVSVSDGFFCTDDGAPIVSLRERRGAVTAGNVLARLVNDPGLVGAPLAACVRRDLVNTHHVRFAPELVIGEDWLFWIDVAQHARFGFTEAVTCKYRWHVQNTTLTASRAYRQAQLWQVRQRVIEAPYFATLPLATRHRFLSATLTEQLTGQPETQDTVMRSDAFKALPRRVQGQLLRLVASDYVLAEAHLDWARRWLAEARRVAPWDLKGRLVAAAVAVDVRLAGRLIRVWRSRRPEQEDRLWSAVQPSPGQVA